MFSHVHGSSTYLFFELEETNQSRYLIFIDYRSVKKKLSLFAKHFFNRILIYYEVNNRNCFIEIIYRLIFEI